MTDALTVNTGAEGKGSRMKICTARLNLRAVTRLSAAFGLALTFAALPAAAQQWTPKQRAACEPAQPACPLTGAISVPPAAPYFTAAKERR
jgi:hypothetical protein